MNFRVTARDNRAGGGGVTTDDIIVTIVGTAGPFTITAPNTAVTWSGSQTVTWNVAGTTASPINAATVNILLSTDGGVTFPFVLATNTPNDGAEMVLLPNVATSQARIKVAAVGNVFFDISDVNFTIASAIPTPQIAWVGSTLVAEDCLPFNGIIDPGEIVTMTFALRNIGSANTTSIVATLTANGGIVPLSGPQNFGALPAGGASVSRPFTFLTTAACGSTATATLQIQSGPLLFPAVTNLFTPGAQVLATNSFANTAAITIPSHFAATPYPSAINISGVAGVITKVTATLSNLTHTSAADVDVLLVGPDGQNVLLMSDTGGAVALSNVTLTFDDAAAGSLPASTLISSGIYKPTNVAQDETFSAPAPAAPYGAALSVFNGLGANGVWSLYVYDDANRDSGSIANGWRLTFNLQTTICCTNIPVPGLSVGDVAVIEGNSGRSEATFPVRLSRASAQPVTVSFNTANGTALAGADYVATNGTAQFAVGITNQNITVGILGDMLFEGDETFSILLSAPVHATLARSLGTMTILDDESRITAVPATKESLWLRFNSVTGATYRVESAEALPATNGWIPVPGAALLPGTGGFLQVLATNSPVAPHRFYRVRQLTP
jgi:subtilisin-like proprotein convertase family protein